MKEQDRLQLVETDLNGRVTMLTDEASSLKIAHQREMDALLLARTEVEGELQKERYAMVKRLEDAIANHQWELTVARGRPMWRSLGCVRWMA